MTNRSKRGRPSIAELTTPVLPLTSVPRQPLPPELAGEEAEVFLAVVNSESADWFSPATIPLLVQYCRHVVQARRIGELLERAVGNRETLMGYYAELLRQQRAESAVVATLATKMRLTQRSIRNDRGNLRPTGSRPARVPWEYP